MGHIDQLLNKQSSSTKAVARESCTSGMCPNSGNCRLYFQAFSRTYKNKHRIYSIFDSPKRCW